MELSNGTHFEITRNPIPSYTSRYVLETRQSSGDEETVSEELIHGLLYTETYSQIIGDEVSYSSTWVTLHIPHKSTRKTSWWQAERDIAAALLWEERRLAKVQIKNRRIVDADEKFLGKMSAHKLFGDAE